MGTVHQHSVVPILLPAFVAFLCFLPAGGVRAVDKKTGPVVINEIMYDPGDGLSEWVEVFNLSNAPTELTGWTLVDRSGNYVTFPDSLSISPRNYLIVTDNAHIGYTLEPNEVYITHNMPLLNNGEETLLISDSTGCIVDSVSYLSSWGGGDGISLERKNPYLPGHVRDNWTSAVMVQGATPCLPNSVLADSFSLSLTDVTIDIRPAEISVTGRLLNTGLQLLESSKVQLFDDQNFDGFFREEEHIGENIMDIMIDVGMSASFSITGTLNSAGRRSVGLKILHDPAGRLLVLDTLVNIPFSAPPLQINEIMYDPDTGPEWVELCNISDQAVSLFGWMLHDRSSVVATITAPGYVAAPNALTVITDDNSVAEFYHVPDSAIVLAPDFPALNNSGDSLSLISPAGEEHDALYYRPSWGGTDGVSLERRNLLVSAEVSSNWGSSTDPAGATPSRVNSIAVPETDGAISLILPEYISRDSQAISSTIRIWNSGLEPIRSYDIVIFHDENEDSLPSSHEQIRSLQGEAIPPGDTVKIDTELPVFASGYHQLIGVVTITGDLNPVKDTTYTGTYIGYPPNCINVNEIMYRPEQGEPEWIELLVRTDRLDLRNFRLHDRGHEARLRHRNYIYHAGDYVILAPDSSLMQAFHKFDSPLITLPDFPVLNNGTDSISLYDPGGRLICGLEYSSHWGGDLGISLERRNISAPPDIPENWGSSSAAIGATPGEVNSIATLPYDLCITDSAPVITPRFPGRYQDWDLLFRIRNAGLNPISSWTVTIRDSDSTHLLDEMFTPNAPLKPGETVDCHIPMAGLESGIHTFTATALHPEDTRPDDNRIPVRVAVSYPRNTLIISEFAPDPAEDWSEFVEVYNSSGSAMDLMRWQIGDGNSFSTITRKKCMLRPGSYAILAADSSIFREFQVPDSVSLFTPYPWPTLSNTGDCITLADPTSQVIDSVSYIGDWAIPGGKSLERRWYLRSPQVLSSNDMLNWQVCVDSLGATPGKLNSVAVRDSCVVTINRIDTLRSVPPDTSVIFLYSCTNRGLEPLPPLELSAGFDLNASPGLSAGEILYQTTLPSLAPLDSTVVRVPLTTPAIPGWIRLTVDLKRLISSGIHSSSFWIPYPEQTLLLTEIFMDPSGFYPYEFFEIYNTGRTPLTLKGWDVRINERSTDLGHITLPPGTLCLVEEDSLAIALDYRSRPSSWNALPNTGASLTIRDPLGHSVDRVTYTESWDLQQGRSLERLHLQPADQSPANWKASFAKTGATPGQLNSFISRVNEADRGWTIEPNPFSPDGDGRDDNLEILYKGSEALRYITIRIFDAAGRLIRTLSRDEPAPATMLWGWDGLTSSDDPAPIGIYLIHLEYKTLNGSEHRRIRTVVLAKQL